jgi:hypothetical protein
MMLDAKERRLSAALRVGGFSRAVIQAANKILQI